MMKSRPEGMRWVLQGIDPETIRTAKTLAAAHEVYLCEVIDTAVEWLAARIDSQGELPNGWKEY